MAINHESGASSSGNPNAAAWDSLKDYPRERGSFVQGPDGKLIPKDQLASAEEAYERRKFYEKNPEAAKKDKEILDHDAEKAKWMERGWIGMTHWYKEHLDEIGDIIPDDSQHDVEYYINEQKKDFRTVGKLVEAYLDRKNPKPDTETTGGTGDTPRITGPVIGDTPRITGPVIGDTPQLPGPTKIEIGDINIRGVEQTFNEIKKEDLEKAEKSLSELQPQIAELYARNRRLIVGGKNRAEFERVKGEYGKIMDQYLRLKTGETFENEKRALGERLEQKLDELKADIEAKLTEFSKSEIGGPYRTQEEVDAEKAKLIKEAETAVKEWYDKEYAGIKTKVNTEFLEGLIKQETDLEKATTNALDNGSFCRKVVSKVLNNKVLKGTLVAASVAGLAVTGVGIATGLAAGTMAVGFNLTGAGFALGAAKGGLGGALMSRQDSKASRVRGFVSREEIAKQISGMDVTNENADVQGVANWMMGEYNRASQQDQSSNRKRSAVSTVIGTLFGGLASGLHFDKVVNKTTTTTEITGRNPIEYKPKLGAENVNVSPNHGYLQIFEQVGGDPSNSAQWDKAFKITEQIAQKYGVTSDMGKGIISPSGVPELLPGKPSTWDTTSQQFINDVLNTWAAKGCIPSVKTGGEAIWSTVTKTVPTVIKNSIWGYLTRATAGITGAAVGGLIGGSGKRSNSATRVTSSTPEGNNPATPESGNNNPTSNPNNPDSENNNSSDSEGSQTESVTPGETNSNPENETITEAETNAVDEAGREYDVIRGRFPNNTSEQNRLFMIDALGRRLGYPGFGDPNNVEAAFSGLSENQRNRLELLSQRAIQSSMIRFLSANGGYSDDEISRIMNNQ